MAKLEVEFKYPLGDRDIAEIWTTLGDAGASFQGAHIERDHYYNAPDRDFKETGEAFRIRRTGKKNRLTYKGPRLPAQAKTREEIEVALAAGDDAFHGATALFESLGYVFVANVEKHRETWGMKHGGFDVSLCFDDVSYVGRFLEIEILAEPEEREAAETALLQLANALTLPEPENRSYLHLRLEKQ